MRAIDADKLLRDIEKYHVSDGKFQHWVQIQPTIEPEPSQVARDIATILENEQDMRVIARNAQPDIIACGDCNHYDRHDKRCKKWNHGVERYDYCSRAEWREDGRI